MNDQKFNQLMAKEIVGQLASKHQKVVFAESCTGGYLASLITRVPGASAVFCGSFVTYRPESKKEWLNVSQEVIDAHSCESEECVRDMAIGALENTVEADWSVAVVGHLGPDCPSEKDGKVWLCVARRNENEDAEVVLESCHLMSISNRIARQRDAGEFALSHFARSLVRS